MTSLASEHQSFSSPRDPLPCTPSHWCSLQTVLHADKKASDLLAGEHRDVFEVLFVVEV